MKITEFRLRREHRTEDRCERQPTERSTPATGNASRGSPTAGRAEAAVAVPGHASLLAVERYREDWHEAATDAELAFRWWIDAHASDRRPAAIGFFAALEREERAACAYQTAWKAWRATPASGEASDEYRDPTLRVARPIRSRVA
jgi:hypothetical protein